MNPYGLDAIVTVLIFFMAILTITFFVLGVRKKQKRLFWVISVLTCILTISIPVVGHSQWNRNWEFAWNIRHLPNSLNATGSDNKAVAMIQKDASNISLVSYLPTQQTDPNECQAVFRVDGTLYDIGFYDNNEPLNWTPYEHWHITSVSYHTN